MSLLPRPGKRPAGVLMFVAMSASIALLGGGQAIADPDVDIESLRGELWRASGEWLLEVRYDIEIEDDLPPPGDLELIVFVTEHGHSLLDQAGRPIEFVVPLVHPSEVDDDELEFEDRIVVALPDGVFDDPGRLRLEGVVVRVGDDCVLDRKNRSIKFEYDYPERRSHYSLQTSVAVGVSVRPVVRHRTVRRQQVVQRRTESVHRRVGIGTHRVGATLRRPSVSPQRASVSHRQVGVQHRISHARRSAVARHQWSAVGARIRR
jgi:hypothetical protein